MASATAAMVALLHPVKQEQPSCQIFLMPRNKQL